MFPVALLSGVLFPIIAAEVQASVGDRMNSTGLATLLNTVGAAVGPLVATLVLLPTLGYQWSLICCAAGYALLSILCDRARNLVIAPPRWDHRCCALGRTRPRFAIFSLSSRRNAFRTCEPSVRNGGPGRCAGACCETHRGRSDTWQLLRRDLFGEPDYYRLLSDAFSMSATSPRNQRYMRLFAYLPLAFLPGAKMCCLFVMDAASQRMLSLANRLGADRCGGYLKGSVRSGRFLFRNQLLEPAARPARAPDRSGRAIFSASQPAAVRHHFGRTASAEGGWRS